jgi:hypothetical protein
MFEKASTFVSHSTPKGRAARATETLKAKAEKTAWLEKNLRHPMRAARTRILIVTADRLSERRMTSSTKRRLHVRA